MDTVKPLELPDGYTVDVEQVLAFPYGDLDDTWFYLGDLHWYKFVTCSLVGDATGGYHGIIQPHMDRYSNWCGGGVTFAGHEHPGHQGATWDVFSLDPLHISPSLLCGSKLYRSGHPDETCGDHGFIRVGRWVKA